MTPGGLPRRASPITRGPSSLRSVSARSHTPRHRSVRPPRRRAVHPGVPQAAAVRPGRGAGPGDQERPVLRAGPHGPPAADVALAGDAWARRCRRKAKVVAYLSAEYLLGRQLDNALLASGLTETAEQSMAGLGHRPGQPARRRGGAGPGQRRPRPAGRLLHRLAGHHADPGRRLRHPLRVRHLPADLRRRRAGRAARLLAGQRLAVGVPAPGDGRSRSGSAGTPSTTRTRTASPGPAGTTAGRCIGIPYNYMVPGYRTGNVNTLRLWSARATQAFDLQVFNTGDYLQAVRSQAFAENISKVLYPEDSTPQGKELRLQQQYFFVACSMRDFIDNVLPPRLRPAPAARTGDLPAQRHPPGDRHPGADADPGRRARAGLGRAPGTSPGSASPTPATPCCRRRSRCGRSSCSAGCCRGTWRSSTGSTRTSWPSCARPTPTTSCGSAGCRSSRSTRSGRSGWPTWPPSAASKVNGVAELHSQLLRDKVLADFSALLAGRSSPT